MEKEKYEVEKANIEKYINENNEVANTITCISDEDKVFGCASIDLRGYRYVELFDCNGKAVFPLGYRCRIKKGQKGVDIIELLKTKFTLDKLIS